MDKVDEIMKQRGHRAQSIQCCSMCKYFVENSHNADYHGGFDYCKLEEPEEYCAQCGDRVHLLYTYPTYVCDKFDKR